jgi:hypothetical protein
MYGCSRIPTAIISLDESMNYYALRSIRALSMGFLLVACSQTTTAPNDAAAVSDKSVIFSPAGPHWEETDPGLREEFAEAHAKAIGGPNERDTFRMYLPQAGPVALLDYLEQKYPICHAQAHALGKELFAQTQDMMVSLQICGTRCTGACMHGVVGEALGGLHGDITEQMEGFCNSDAMAVHKRGNCAHAIGHALLLNSRDLGYALESCEGFGIPAMRYYCATGVYMQYRDWLNEGEIPDERPTALYPCDAQSLYPAACYRYMMTFIQDEFGGRSDLITDACLDLPDYERWGCFHGLGMQFGTMIQQWVEYDKNMFGDLCGHGTLVDQTMCVEGAIEKMADFDEALAQAACDTLSGELADICHSAASEKMYRLDKPSLKYYVSQDAPPDAQ